MAQVPSPDSYVFPSAWPFGNIHWNHPIDRFRAHKIMKQTTGKFPHWLRGWCKTLYGKKIFKNDPWQLKEFMGLCSIESTAPYVATNIEKAVDEFNQAT